MKRKFAFGVLLLILTASAVYYKGRHDGRHDVWLEEYKTYNGALKSTAQDNLLEPVSMIDFLKARYYFLSNKLPRRDLSSPKDYGPVDFHALAIGKETSPFNEHRIFKDRLLDHP